MRCFDCKFCEIKESIRCYDTSIKQHFKCEVHNLTIFNPSNAGCDDGELKAEIKMAA